MIQAVAEMIRVKKRRSRPVIIAPIILVAAKVIASKITAVKIVPKIPVKKIGRTEQIHSLVEEERESAAEIRATPKYKTAIPNSTHKNAGVTVMVAVIAKTVVTTPITTLAKTDKMPQLLLKQ